MASMLSWSKRSILSVLCVFGLVFLLQCGKTAEDAPGTTGEDDPSADPSTDPDADPGTDPGTDPGNPEHPDPNTMVLPGLDGEESDDLSRIKGSHLRAKFLKPLSEGHYYPPEQLEDLYFNPLEVCTKNFTVAGLVELAEKLGGIKWGYRIDYYENFLTPQFDLYGYPAMMAPGAMEDSANMASSPGDAAPVIQRADLIGSMGTKVFYLSKRNGLFFVDTARLADGSAAISCPLLVPGEPKNFYIQGEHLYLLANAGYGAQNAAVIVFRAGERSVEYVGHHLLEHQTILDSRLFDSTLAVYAAYYPPQGEQQAYALTDEPMSSSPMYYGYQQSGKYMLTVLQLDQGTLERKFEEQLEETVEDLVAKRYEQQTITGEGDQPADFALDEVVYKQTRFNTFLSASDEYLVISKTLQQRLVVGHEIEHRQICKRYNPKYHKVEYTNHYCYPIWDRVENPDFDSDFSCSSAEDFEACLNTNLNKFVKAYWLFKGEQCKDELISYWEGRCEEHGTIEIKHPLTKDHKATDFLIYRFKDKTFTRLDDPEGKDVIRIPGHILEYKSLQFQLGYFYAVATDGNPDPGYENYDTTELLHTNLSTFKLKGNAFIRLHELEDLGRGQNLSAVLFNGERLFLDLGGLYQLDLSAPQEPVLSGLTEFPGRTAQLISTGDHLVGIGQYDHSVDTRHVSHMQLTLFKPGEDSINQVDFERYGTESENSYNLVGSDDQVFHYQAAFQRLFVPYEVQGGVPNNVGSLVCSLHNMSYRLAVTEVEGDALSTLGDFDFNREIIRTYAYEDAAALSFADAGVYQLQAEAGGTWKKTVIEEEPIIEGLYVDPSLPEDMVVARLSVRSGWEVRRLFYALGTRKQIADHQYVDRIEVKPALIECLGAPHDQRFLDAKLLISYRQMVMRDDPANPANKLEIEYYDRLAWQIDENGFTALPEEEAKALQEVERTYCRVPDTRRDYYQGLSNTSQDELYTKLDRQDLLCESASQRDARYEQERLERLEPPPNTNPPQAR